MTRTCLFVGDEAFQLTRNMTRLYSGRNLDYKKIFNYTIASLSRKIIENTFGILVLRWRIFRKQITIHPKYIDRIIVAMIYLYNFLKTVSDSRPVEHRIYCPPNFIDIEEEDSSIIFLEYGEMNRFARSTTIAYKQWNSRLFGNSWG